MNPSVQLIDLAGATDGAGTLIGPCSVLLEGDSVRWPELTLLAIGKSEDVRTHPAMTAANLEILDASDHIAIPGLVNAHTHLDLTHMGPREFPKGQSFVDWVDMVRAGRVSGPEEIRRSVSEGATRSIEGGVVAVGDIAGVFGVEAVMALAATPLRGIVGIEIFGIGARQNVTSGLLDDLAERAERALDSSDRIEWTWQPHAPYSVGLRLYRDCANRCVVRGVPMMTHLAETPEERQFIADADGPQRKMLERLGAWDDSCMESIGKRQSPIEYLSQVLADAPTIAAHVNYASDSDIEALAKSETTIAYCPRASEYFRQHEAFGPHRYLEMLAAGINVVLGTDSIINLPQEQSSRMTTLDDARLLVRRDGIDPNTALGMATWRGAQSLSLDTDGFSLRPSNLPRRLFGLNLVRVRSGSKEPAAAIMQSEHTARLVRLTGGNRHRGFV